jgi:hypothetical protein
VSTNPFDPADSPFRGDADDTDELPVLDPSAAAADEAEPEQTDDDALVPVVPVSLSELVVRLREVEQQLEQKSALVSELEVQRGQTDQHLAALADELTASRARQAELESLLQEARANARQQSQSVTGQQVTAVRYREQDLSDLRNRTERQLEALSTWQGFRAVSDALLSDAEARNSLLEAKVSSLTETVRALESNRPRSAPQSQSEALNAQVSALKAQVTTLRAELAVARKARQADRTTEVVASRVRDADGAEPTINATVTMYGDKWEYSEEEVEPSPTGELEKPVATPGTSAPGSGPLVRELVRQDDGGNLIYPIGRRTTIGRTPDNDVQIDAPNVSRHHAVLLVSSESCYIEDLNSTNGVLVNGALVARQKLQNGDIVIIGKTQFRFTQRQSDE